MGTPNRALVVVGIAAAALLAVGCGAATGGSPGLSAQSSASTAAPTAAAPTPDANLDTLQSFIMGQGPQWSAADAANGHPDTETVNSVSCIATGPGNYSCNANYTITGNAYPSINGHWTVTIPGACDSTGHCQTQVSGSPVRAGT